jgi:hypothetical protein
MKWTEMKSKALLQKATANLYDKGGAGALTAAAKAEAKQPSLAEITLAKDAIKKANPQATEAQIEELLQSYLPNYKPIPTLPPLIRGADTGGATLPGT